MENPFKITRNAGNPKIYMYYFSLRNKLIFIISKAIKKCAIKWPTPTNSVGY